MPQQQRFGKDDRICFNRQRFGGSEVLRNLGIEDEVLEVREIRNDVLGTALTGDASDGVEVDLPQSVLVSCVGGDIICLRCGYPLWFDAEMFTLAGD